jgi:hypothetical protein
MTPLPPAVEATTSRYTRDNLTSYSARMLDQVETATAALPDDEVLEAWVVPWCVLGIPRLHALLATGNIISNGAAGGHAVAVAVA